MLMYTLRRVLLTIPIFFGVTIMIWLIATTNPDGGALAAYIGPSPKILTPQQVAAIKHRLGLDQPLPVRYVIWIKNLFRGDLGVSIITKQNVLTSIRDRVGPTLLLLGTAFILQELLALPLGIFSAVRRGSVFDQIFTVIAYVLFAFPTFWLGLMTLTLFAVELKVLPFGGINDITKSGDAFGSPQYWAYFHANTVSAILDIAKHMIMPVTVLALVNIAGDSRFMRGQMLEVLNQDYVRTARAKGASERLVVLKHALRNALLPIITNIGLQLPGLVGGAIVTEQIFSWPGTGQFYIKAANAFDYPSIIAYLVILGGLILIFNILTDLSYALVDPRIRYS
jgi:peptide/nickel transport system permease protein